MELGGRRLRFGNIYLKQSMSLYYLSVSINLYVDVYIYKGCVGR